MKASEPDSETKTCPRCAENIKAKAIVCRYCGAEFFNVDERNAEDKNNNNINQGKYNKNNNISIIVALTAMGLIGYGLYSPDYKNNTAMATSGTLMAPEERLPALTGAALQKAALAEVPDIRRSIEPPPIKIPTLRVANWHWSEVYSYAIIEGMVTNQSSDSIDNILAVATFFDNAGNLITSNDSLIEYRPLLPGQTSPFKVMVPYNPAMKSANLDFKTFRGQRLDWEEGKKKPTDVQAINESRLIEIVQGYLIFLGYLKGDITRKIDERTIESVRKFQGDYGLDSDGKISVELATAARVASQRLPVRDVVAPQK